MRGWIIMAGMAKRKRQRIDTMIDFHVWEARKAKTKGC
jgi:hypothetical protein